MTDIEDAPASARTIVKDTQTPFIHLFKRSQNKIRRFRGSPQRERNTEVKGLMLAAREKQRSWCRCVTVVGWGVTIIRLRLRCWSSLRVAMATESSAPVSARFKGWARRTLYRRLPLLTLERINLYTSFLRSWRRLKAGWVGRKFHISNPVLPEYLYFSIIAWSTFAWNGSSLSSWRFFSAYSRGSVPFFVISQNNILRPRFGHTSWLWKLLLK